MREYAKAIAGAVTAIVVYIVAEVGFDLPAEVVAALEVLVTGAVVYFVKNRRPAVPVATVEGRRR